MDYYDSESDENEDFIESREKQTREFRCLFPADFIGPPKTMFEKLTENDEDGRPKMRDIEGTQGKVKIQRKFIIPGTKAKLGAGKD